MTSENDPKGIVEDDLFHKAYDDLSTLHTQLPEEAVVDLAREVLKRLASQLRDRKVDAERITELAEALIGSENKAAAKMIESHIRDGVSFNDIYLEYLSPAAALLGQRWESDDITFADVTVGTGRIYAIMRAINRRSRPSVPPETRSAIFAMVPGDDHGLGLKMAVDLARKEGWDIEAHLDSDHDTLVDTVTTSDALLIGLSAGGIHSLPNLARLVLALRISAPNAKILVSGNIAALALDQVELLHVDAVATSFEDAMAQLNGLWDSFRASDDL